MEEYTEDAFANRDEPIPLLTVNSDDVEISSSDNERAELRSRLKKSVSATRLKEKARALQDESSQESPAGKMSIQDRLFTKLLSQVVPIEDLDDTEEEKVDRRSSSYVKRPSFSLPTMTNNFRRFNARIGIVFVFQNRCIRLFGWRNPSHTLSFLAVYTFVCLDPYLLVALPLAIALLFVMVPAFTTRHPPPPTPVIVSSSGGSPSKYDQVSAYSYSGPALAPAKTIRPAAETSKDFFRNMRDLQNSMADFSDLHDALVSNIAPATNFSNEILSSTIFLYLTLSTTILFIAAHLIPFRIIALFGGYALIISSHPQVQTWLIKQQKRASRKSQSQPTQSQPLTILGIPVPSNPTAQALTSTLTSLSAITLTTTPETREVEIFELQHRPILPLSSSASTAGALYEWQPHVFTPNPYDPLSPARISGDRPRGTRFFEDVQPPNGWEWESKKWELDLESEEWVNERLIVGVEFDEMHPSKDSEEEDVSDKEDEMIETFAAKRSRQQSVNLDFGGWVWDLPPAVGTSGNRDEDVWLAYGDYDIPGLNAEKEEKRARAKKGKGHKKGASSGTGKDWEESVRYGNKGRTGEWRRRRWVRVVKRVAAV